MKIVVAKRSSIPSLEKLWVDAFSNTLEDVLERKDAEVKIYFARGSEDVSRISCSIYQQVGQPGPLIVELPAEYIERSLRVSPGKYSCILDERELGKLSYDAITGLATHIAHHLNYQEERNWSYGHALCLPLGVARTLLLSTVADASVEEFWVVVKSAETSPGGTMAIEWELREDGLSELEKSRSKVVEGLIEEARLNSIRPTIDCVDEWIQKWTLAHAKVRALETSNNIPPSFCEKFSGLGRKAESLEEQLIGKAIRGLKRRGYTTSARLLEDKVSLGKRLRERLKEGLTADVFHDPDETYRALRRIRDEFV